MSEDLAPLIFLDFDGVLCSLGWRGRAKDPELRAADIAAADARMAVLNDLLARSGAQIVVTSSWRDTTERMAKLLASWGCVGEVVGITPKLVEKLTSGKVVASPRGKEIDAYLFRRAWENASQEERGRAVHIGDLYFGPFVVLDDSPLTVSYEDGHLVLVDGAVGLTAADTERALAVLHGELVTIAEALA